MPHSKRLSRGFSRLDLIRRLSLKNSLRPSITLLAWLRGAYLSKGRCLGPAGLGRPWPYNRTVAGANLAIYRRLYLICPAFIFKCKGSVGSALWPCARSDPLGYETDTAACDSDGYRKSAMQPLGSPTMALEIVTGLCSRSAEPRIRPLLTKVPVGATRFEVPYNIAALDLDHFLDLARRGSVAYYRGMEASLKLLAGQLGFLPLCEAIKRNREEIERNPEAPARSREESQGNTNDAQTAVAVACACAGTPEGETAAGALAMWRDSDSGEGW